MRTVLILLAGAAALTVSACATPAPSSETYSEQMRELADACQARGGILAPTGQQSSNPARDSICKVNAETARAGRSRDD